MSGLFEDLEGKFIFRRAFRAGSVNASDVAEAFGLTSRTAERHFKDFWETPIAQLNPVLRRGGRSIMPIPHAVAPSFASEEDLVDALGGLRCENGRGLFFALTGLREDEISVTRSAWLNNMPATSGALTVVCDALRQKKPIQIKYVGLNRHDSAATGIQQIVPLSLQVIGDQLSLYALRLAKYDAKAKAWTIEEGVCTRTFVLPRVLSATFSLDQTGGKLKKAINLPHKEERMVRQEVRFNPSLTADQKKVLANELRVDNDSVTLPDSRMFQFLRLYSDQKIGADSVWPPLIKSDPNL
jgi:hypothetical protein